MFLKKISITVLFLFGLTFKGFAGANNQKNIFIITEKVSEKFVSKLKPVDLEVYKNLVNSYNSNILKSIYTIWKSGQVIKTVSRDSLEIKKNDLVGHYVLECSLFTENFSDPSSFMRAWRVYLNGPEDYNQKDLKSRMCKLELKEYDLKGFKSILHCQLPDVSISEAWIYYACKVLYYQYDQKEKGMSELQRMRGLMTESQRLKNETLLINALDNSTSDSKFIKAFYPYSFELVTSEVISNCILNPCAGKILCIKHDNDDGSASYRIYDPVLGSYLAQSSTAKPTEDDPRLKIKISEKNLEEFIKYIDQ